MKKRKTGLIFTWMASFLLPIFIVFLVIGFHSNELIFQTIHLIIFLLLFASILLLCAGLFILHRNKKEKTNLKKGQKIVIIVLLTLEIIGSSTFLFLLYGPYASFRTFLISSAMTTMNHRYLATWFYSEEEIEKVLNENKFIELDEDTNLNLINIEENNDKNMYENKYEEAILKKEHEDDVYKIIPISEKNFEGYLAVIYDPARIFAKSTKYLNRAGQYVTEMAAEEKALLAINGGGFLEDRKSVV